MNGKYLEYLSWQEAEKALTVDTLVLIPLGAQLKEHGPHLPLNTDWIMALSLTDEIVKKLPVLAAPGINHCYYPAMVEYPGTVSLEESTASSLIANVISSLSRFGPKYFYILNTGISTIRILETIKKDFEKLSVSISYTDLRRALEPARSQLEEQEGGTHADEIETSIMLALAPHIVNMELAQEDFHGNDKGPLRRDRQKPGVYSPTGTWGNPTLASREKGEKLVRCLLDSIEKDIKEIISKMS